jgi:2-keto-3-deoxy-L-rhamnonate aldolase RhmA
VTSLKERLRAGDLIAATWVKTPHPHVVEVLALSGLDALAIDAEHAPFDRAAIDLAVLGSKASAMPVLVRVASASPEAILQALDSGADGIIAPHIRSAAEAEALVRHCHHGPGGRGFAGSSRAAGYTTLGMAGSREAARKRYRSSRRLRMPRRGRRGSHRRGRGHRRDLHRPDRPDGFARPARVPTIQP